jgi:hypothetical protein
MTENDKKIIDSQDHKTLAAWWVKLNKWGWPKKLPNKPKDRHNDDNRGWSIMCYIKGIIGRKATSWEWNKDRMSPEYFEEWYVLTYATPKQSDEEHWELLKELNKKHERNWLGKRI